MATPDREETRVDRPLDSVDLSLCLDDLRREISAIRRELAAGDRPLPTANEESYRLATQIDLLVNRFLRLHSTLAGEG